jgi:tricorn protease-like protein
MNITRKILLTTLPMLASIIGLACCNSSHSRQPQPMRSLVQQASTEPEYSIVKKQYRGKNSMVSELYTQQLEQDTSLARIDERYHATIASCDDSLEAWTNFYNTNISYYQQAQQHLQSIADSAKKRDAVGKIEAKLQQFELSVQSKKIMAEQLEKLKLSAQDDYALLQLSVADQQMQLYQKEQIDMKAVSSQIVSLNSIINAMQQLSKL